MTSRITVTLPDDVADHLKKLSNVSAYVTDALRSKIDKESLRGMMARHGVDVTDQGVARARSFLARRRAELDVASRGDRTGA